MSAADCRTSSLCGLDEIYCRLTAEIEGDYRETWRLFAANRRYQQELESAARRLVYVRRLRRERVRETVHDALLVLADCLRANGTLGFDPRFGQERFLAWVRAVARSHCRLALRRRRARRYLDLDEEWAAVDESARARAAELAVAIESLGEQEREVVDAFRRLGSLEAVARELNISVTTAWRRWRTAVTELRSACCGDLPSGRLVGISNPAKKW